MAEILFEHCQLKISEKVLVQYEKLYEFITSTLQFQISTYKPLIIEKYHVTQQDMLNIMETLKGCIASEYKTDFVIIHDSQKHSDQIENTDLKCSSNEVHDIERTPVINSGPSKVVSREEGISKDDAEENMTSCKKIFSKSKMEMNGMNFEQTLRKADPEERSCLSGCKDMNSSESGCKSMNNSEAKVEAKVNEVRKEVTTNKLEAQNASDIRQVQGKSDKNQSEFTFNWTEDWQFECAEWYMDTKFSRSFFNAAVRKDTQVTFRLSNSNPQVKLFIRLLQQLKFEKIIFNDGNKQQAQRLAEQVMCKTSAKVKVLAGHFMIVGLKEEVSEAKRMITKNLQSQDEAEFRSSENMHMQEENSIGRSRQTLNDLPNKFSWYEYEHTHVKCSGFHDEDLKTANLSTSELSKNQFPSSQRSHEQGSYQRGLIFQTEKSKLIVQIQNADITTFKADCIVNAANRRLQHRGGVAKAIAEAAGWELMKDCEDYIKKGKTVDVTDIFVSKGGRLPAKFVLHAVGPMWEVYDDKKWCLDDLRCTVLRCLVEAARRGMSSIALPFISAAIFKVPKEHCARCYMEAVKHFDIFNAREGSPLQEIYFIDVDDTMVNYIIECFLDNWEKPSDREMLHKDLSFAENHIRSTFKKMSSDYTKPKSSILPAPSGANEATSSTGAVRKSDRNKSYHFGRVILHLKSGHAFDCSAGITITVGKLFDKLSGLPDFQIKQNLKRDDSMPHRKNGYEFFNVSKPNGKQSRLLLTTYPEPDKAETIEESFHNLEMGIQTCDPHQVQRKILQGLIITSSLLYAEPKNSQKQKGGKKRCDRKMIGTFANFLHKFVEKVSKNYTLTVTVVGSEDDLPVIEKVMDSRNVPSAPGAYPNSTARSEGNKSGPRSQAQGERSTQSQYDQTQGERSGSGRYQYGQNQGERVKHGQFDQTQRGNHYQNPPDRPQSGPGAVSSAASSDDMPGLYHNSGSQRNSANTSMNTQNLEHSSMGTSVDSQMKCKICLDEDKHCYSTSCCKNMICLKCETRLSSCPFCRKIWKILKGNQPDGTMSAKLISDSADGYENFGTWKIDYFFPFGKQKDHHPNPGKPYRSVMRTAYLPDSDDGFQLLMLLRLAFVRRLTFTIGHSHTKNVDDVITWNDIHHKTSLHGGIFGYPDPAYIMRAMTELADRGVTFDTVTEEEKHDLNKFHYYCKNLKHFF